jgi:hypothetical protein
MYSSVMDNLKDQMKPIADLTALGTQVFEKMLKKHVDLAGDCFEAGLAQARQYSSPKDLSVLVGAQSMFMADMGKKMFDLAKFDMELMAEANQALAGMLESSMKAMSNMPAWMNIKPA